MKKLENSREYDVVIIGAGISGTALLYVLSNYTDIKKIAIIEKYGKVAQVNSNSKNNSQTLLFGDIETNYTLEKATKVKQAADMVVRYVEKTKNKKKLFSKYHKMVLAVGKDQTDFLKNRHKKFKKLFPNLKLIKKEEIGKLESKIVEGRSPDEEIVALFSEDGYTMDYGNISESFLENALKSKDKKIDVLLNSKVESIKKEDHRYEVETGESKINASVVVVAAGGHSLLFAKSLGYGKDFSILSVAGSFYFAPKTLNGKVYTLQMEKLPFAAIHGDPEVHNQSQTRFGPTAKVIPLLERHNYKTVSEYFKTFGFSTASIKSIFNILSDKILFRYVFTQFMYDLPLIGKRLFIKEVKKIIPSIKLKDLKFAKGYGGTRPQIINTKTKTLDMGEAKIIGENIIFNITPSPGASTCLKNAYVDTKKIVEFLDQTFNEKEFKKNFVD